MKVSDFDYDLPPELIAQTPIEPRDQSRLMVLDPDGGNLRHQYFSDLPQYLQPNDLLVVNQSRVLPARLYGIKAETGGKVELLLLHPLSDGKWECLVKPGRRCSVGTKLFFSPELSGTVIANTEAGGRIIEFDYDGDFDQILERLGETPLPPYITEQLEDKQRYQTVYATAKGSVAAPTAGLHFTEELLDQISNMGVKIVPLLLHVGIGTFRPVKTELVAEHKMHSEYYHLSEENAAIINQAKAAGNRIIAVGTTTVRTLETLGQSGAVVAGSGWTDIFIYPGYQFKIVDAMITNFHLPQSSLLMLVSAFSGQSRIKQAYKNAIENKYRFFSFGDAMLLFQEKEYDSCP